MSYKYLLVALLGLSMTGCAVYGDGYDHGYRNHDRGYYGGHDRVQRHPVYVAPRYYSYDDRRYSTSRYTGRHYDQRRYVPPPRYYGNDRRPEYRRDDHRRHDYRSAQPRPGWNGRHYQLQERSPQPHRYSNTYRRDGSGYRSPRRHR